MPEFNPVFATLPPYAATVYLGSAPVDASFVTPTAPIDIFQSPPSGSGSLIREVDVIVAAASLPVGNPQINLWRYDGTTNWLVATITVNSTWTPGLPHIIPFNIKRLNKGDKLRVSSVTGPLSVFVNVEKADF
ncbi:MAG: hypothetical protein KGH75_04470 [Rhodospirillales bacterium]|nr:hypothetical protein [Rhodospirillales bacterium]